MGPATHVGELLPDLRLLASEGRARLRAGETDALLSALESLVLLLTERRLSWASLALAAQRLEAEPPIVRLLQQLYRELATEDRSNGAESLHHLHTGLFLLRWCEDRARTLQRFQRAVRSDIIILDRAHTTSPAGQPVCLVLCAYRNVPTTRGAIWLEAEIWSNGAPVPPRAGWESWQAPRLHLHGTAEKLPFAVIQPLPRAEFRYALDAVPLTIPLAAPDVPPGTAVEIVVRVRDAAGREHTQTSLVTDWPSSGDVPQMAAEALPWLAPQAIGAFEQDVANGASIELLSLGWRDGNEPQFEISGRCTLTGECPSRVRAHLRVYDQSGHPVRAVDGMSRDEHGSLQLCGESAVVGAHWRSPCFHFSLLQQALSEVEGTAVQFELTIVGPHGRVLCGVMQPYKLPAIEARPTLHSRIRRLGKVTLSNGSPISEVERDAGAAGDPPQAAFEALDADAPPLRTFEASCHRTTLTCSYALPVASAQEGLVGGRVVLRVTDERGHLVQLRPGVGFVGQSGGVHPAEDPERAVFVRRLTQADLQRPVVRGGVELSLDGFLLRAGNRTLRLLFTVFRADESEVLSSAREVAVFIAPARRFRRRLINWLFAS